MISSKITDQVGAGNLKGLYGAKNLIVVAVPNNKNFSDCNSIIGVVENQPIDIANGANISKDSALEFSDGVSNLTDATLDYLSEKAKQYGGFFKDYIPNDALNILEGVHTAVGKLTDLYGVARPGSGTSIIDTLQGYHGPSSQPTDFSVKFRMYSGLNNCSLNYKKEIDFLTKLTQPNFDNDDELDIHNYTDQVWAGYISYLVDRKDQLEFKNSAMISKAHFKSLSEKNTKFGDALNDAIKKSGNKLADGVKDALGGMGASDFAVDVTKALVSKTTGNAIDMAVKGSQALRSGTQKINEGVAGAILGDGFSSNVSLDGSNDASIQSWDPYEGKLIHLYIGDSLAIDGLWCTNASYSFSKDMEYKEGKASVPLYMDVSLSFKFHRMMTRDEIVGLTLFTRDN